MKKLNLLFIAVLCTTVVACGKPKDHEEEVASDNTTESELNQPVDPDPNEQETGEEETEPTDPPPVVVEPEEPPPVGQTYFMPRWESSFGITQTMYERVKDYYDRNWKSFPNNRYVVIIDMGLRSDKKRFVLFDLKEQTVVKHLTSHGAGSDPNNDRYLDSFSNTSGSKKTSSGYYRTAETYTGKHGRSMRMDGLSSTNTNARRRAIVVHGANYVREPDSYAGRSWGCPALDNAVAQGVINKIKGGALLVVGTSRSL